MKKYIKIEIKFMEFRDDDVVMSSPVVGLGSSVLEDDFDELSFNE